MNAKPFAVGIALFLIGGLPAAAQPDRGDCGGRKPEGWSVVVAGPAEPGARLVVEGRVLAADGESPVAGATVLVFHTDAEGYYSPGGMDEGNARLCGVMRTDEEGRYRFETIRPAHYATGGGPAAHVHYEVWGEGLSKQTSPSSSKGIRSWGAAAPTPRATRPGIESVRFASRTGPPTWCATCASASCRRRRSGSRSRCTACAAGSTSGGCRSSP